MFSGTRNASSYFVLYENINKMQRQFSNYYSFLEHTKVGCGIYLTYVDFGFIFYFIYVLMITNYVFNSI